MCIHDDFTDERVVAFEDEDFHSDPDFEDECPDEGDRGERGVTSWRVAESLITLRNQINAKMPSRSKASDGTIGDTKHAARTSDHNPWITDGGKGIVTAFDITHDPANGCDAGKIAEAIRNSKDSRVKYIIWNKKIANHQALDGQPAWTWRAYKGSNPHTKHVHISVKSDKASYDSTVAWKI